MPELVGALACVAILWVALRLLTGGSATWGTIGGQTGVSTHARASTWLTLAGGVLFILTIPTTFVGVQVHFSGLDPRALIGVGVAGWIIISAFALRLFPRVTEAVLGFLGVIAALYTIAVQTGMETAIAASILIFLASALLRILGR